MPSGQGPTESHKFSEPGSIPGLGTNRNETMNFKEFINFFAHNKKAKVLSYGFNSKTNTGWVTFIFEPYNDDSETITLHTDPPPGISNVS